MTVTKHTLTGDIGSLVGGVFTDDRGTNQKVAAWLETNLAGDALVDTLSNVVMLGSLPLTLSTDLTFSQDGLIATNSTGVNPTGVQYRAHVSYVDLGLGRRVEWVSNWFDLTADVDLADVVAAVATPPNYQSTFLAAAQALLDAQIDLSSIDDSDAEVATLISNGTFGPLTRAAIFASTGQMTAVSKTANYTVAAQEFVEADATSGVFTVTGPAAGAVRRWGVKKVNGTSAIPGNKVTISYLNASGAATSLDLTLAAESKVFRPSGSGWRVEAGDTPQAGVAVVMDSKVRALAVRPPDLTGAALTVGVTVQPLEFFGGYVWGITGTTLKKSSDGGATWATVATLPSASVSRLIPTSDGELVLTNGSIIWKTSGWTANPATATYVVKVNKSAPAGVGIRPWGINGGNPAHPGDVDAGATKFIANEYSGADRTESRYVWISIDSGTTWAVAFDNRTLDATGTLSHWHGCEYDPWEDRFWTSNGHDTTPRGLYYSGDNGATWTHLISAFQPDASPCTLTATDDGIVCGSDSADGGLYGIPRVTDPARLEIRRTARWATTVDGVAGFAERGFRDPSTGLVYVSFNSATAGTACAIAAGSARTGAFIWKESTATTSRFPWLVVTSTGKLLATIDRTGSYDLVTGQVLSPGVVSFDNGNVTGGVSLAQTSVAVGPGSVTGTTTAGRQVTAVGALATGSNQGDTVIGYAAGQTSPAGSTDKTHVGRGTYAAGSGAALGAVAAAATNAVALGANTTAAASNDASIGARQLVIKRLSGDAHPAVPAVDEIQNYHIQVNGRETWFRQYRDGRRIQPDIAILASVIGINAKAVATTSLLTVPASCRAVITEVRIRATAATSVTGVPTLGVGVAAGEDDIMPSTALTGLTSTGLSWSYRASGLMLDPGPASVIKLGIDTGGASVTTYTLAVELIGYLL